MLPPRSSCSVGRRAQDEVGEIEPGHDDAADQAGLVVARHRALPQVPGMRPSEHVVNSERGGRRKKEFLCNQYGAIFEVSH